MPCRPGLGDRTTLGLAGHSRCLTLRVGGDRSDPTSPRSRARPTAVRLSVVIPGHRVGRWGGAGAVRAPLVDPTPRGSSVPRACQPCCGKASNEPRFAPSAGPRGGRSCRRLGVPSPPARHDVISAIFFRALGRPGDTHKRRTDTAHCRYERTRCADTRSRARSVRPQVC
jgi:hypothetical protein